MCSTIIIKLLADGDPLLDIQLLSLLTASIYCPSSHTAIINCTGNWLFSLLVQHLASGFWSMPEALWHHVNKIATRNLVLSFKALITSMLIRGEHAYAQNKGWTVPFLYNLRHCLWKTRQMCLYMDRKSILFPVSNLKVCYFYQESWIQW